MEIRLLMENGRSDLAVFVITVRKISPFLAILKMYNFKNEMYNFILRAK